MNTPAILALIIWALIILISILLRVVIRADILKPNRFTRIFYEDDAFFRETWNKVQAKGVIKYCIRQVLIMTGTVAAVSLYFVLSNRTNLQDAITLTAMIGVIGGGIGSFIGWNVNQDRYSNLRG